MLAWLIELGFGAIELGLAATAVALLVDAAPGRRGPACVMDGEREHARRGERPDQAADT